MAVIDYYFTLLSPWSYLGHRALVDLAARQNATIRFRPVMLGRIFTHAGATPLAERPKARQDYRLVDLQRWRARRGLQLNLNPRHFPTNPSLADRTLIAMVEAGEDPDGFAEGVFRACWTEDRDIADRALIASVLQAAGHAPETLIAAAGSDESAAIYTANTEAAIRVNVIGAPTYVLNGEPFWGQDRLDLLTDALVSRRAPFAVAG